MNISLIFVFQHIFSHYHLQITGAQTTLTYLDKASFTRHDYTLVGISNWSINLDQRLPNHPSYSQSRSSYSHTPLMSLRPWGPGRWAISHPIINGVSFSCIWPECTHTISSLHHIHPSPRCTTLGKWRTSIVRSSPATMSRSSTVGTQQNINTYEQQWKRAT